MKKVAYAESTISKWSAHRAPSNEGTPLAESAPRQRKLCMTPLRRRRTLVGIRKADMKCVGMAERTAFARTRRPPRDSSLPCQPPRRVSIFSITGCQSRILRRGSVSGKPKYRRGSVSIGDPSLLIYPVQFEWALLAASSRGH